MAITEPHIHQWTREDYDHAVAAGIFDGKHVQLIAGEIIEMSPMGSRHASMLTTAYMQLIRSLPDYLVRIQMPLSLDAMSEPEPDIAVVAGPPETYATAHPTTALLVIEVSDATLAYDRTTKASLYASASIPEYWILNLVAGHIEVLRQPTMDATQRFGFGYADRFVVEPGGQLAPLCSPTTVLEVSALLPA